MLFKKNLKFASFMAVTVFLTLGLSISFSSLLAAWTAPTAAPPAGNTAPLIYNESATPATSALIDVPLGVSGNLTVNPGGIITGDGSSITSINASSLSAGTVPNARLNAHLQDLADGELSGGKVGSGIDGDNITNGTIDSSEIEDNTLTASDLADNACGSAELEDSPVFVNPTASIPTVNNHVATKEYVDAAIGVKWAGYATNGGFDYDGDLNGVKGANIKCNSEHSGSHWCSWDEIVKLGNLYPDTEIVWINVAPVEIGATGMDCVYLFPDGNGLAVPYAVAPDEGKCIVNFAHHLQTGSCGGWRSVFAYGTMLIPGLIILFNDCSDDHVLPCCE